HEEKSDVLGREIPVDTRRIAALRQPDAARIASEMHAVVRAGDLDLRLDRLGMDHQRQKTVRRSTSNDLDRAGVLKPLERPDDVALVAIVEEAAQVTEM